MYNEINDLINDMYKAFEGAYKNVKNPILVDVVKNEDSYDVYASLVGVKKEDVKLTFENGKLTISVDEKKEDDNKEAKYLVKERINGFNPRSVFLKDADSSKITAKMENGVLTVNVPFIKKTVNTIVIE